MFVLSHKFCCFKLDILALRIKHQRPSPKCPPTLPITTSIKPNHTTNPLAAKFERAIPFSMVVPGFGSVEGACVNSYFVVYSRISADFSLDKVWKIFKKGFGVRPDNFHIGNEALYQLTTSGKYYAKAEMVTKSTCNS